MRNQIMKRLEECYEEMIELRRALHQIPELSYHEEKTSEYILDYYNDLPVKIDRNVNGSYGILITINEGKSDEALALRADFDGLPIQEATDLQYRSTHEGRMHACGHDGHTAYLLVLAKVLCEFKDELPGEIKIIHQHAEEVPPGGAQDFMESGLLNNVARIYGIHLNPIGPLGTVIYAEKELMAGSGTYRLKITGKGAHGSAPQEGNDAIVAGAYYITAIQTIISRRLSAQDEGVITFGNFEGKGAPNVIAEHVYLEATLRYFDKNIEKKMVAELNDMSEGLAKMFNVVVDYEYETGFYATINNEEVMNEARQVFEKAEYITNLVKMPPSMGSEDFSTYLQTIPGAYYIIGGSPDGLFYKYMNHNPRFNFDEGALLIAAKSVADLVLEYYK